MAAHQASPIPGILQARTLEWVAISFSNAWVWKMKGKVLSCVWLLATPWTAAHQAPLSMGFSRQEYWSGAPLPSPTTKPRCQQICSHGLQSILGLLWGFPGSAVVKNQPCQCRSCRRQGFDPWVGKNPVFLPGEFHGQRSLAGYTPWGHKQLDVTKTTEHVHACPETCCLPKKDVFQNISAHCQWTGHSMALMKICNEISVVFMPTNTTSILHPMDHRIISDFKFYYLRHIFRKALPAVDGDLSMDLSKVKLKTFWKGFTVLDPIKNICNLWEEVTISTLKRFWKKLIPTPHGWLCGVQDILVLCGSTDVIERAKELDFEVEPEDVSELLQTNDKTFTDEELYLMSKESGFLR